MRSLLVKFAIIGIIIIGLLIPVQLVNSLVKERAQRRNNLLIQMGRAWGKPQQFSGIYLLDNNKVYLPARLEIKGNITSAIRKKGIFKIPFYTAELIIIAHFNNSIKTSNIDSINLLLSDENSVIIQELTWGDYKFKNVNPYKKNSRLRIKLPSNQDKINNKNILKLKIKFSGLDSLTFLALAANNKIEISSNWNDPNFNGIYLPEKREINNKGFIANWKVATKKELIIKDEKSFLNSLHLNKSDMAFGVSLFIPVDIYQQTERTIKYAILFIFLTLLTFFIIEILNTIKIHPMQYILVGCALTLFYLLLLSLSEHISFVISYIFAALATIGLITAYSSKILQNRNRTLIMCGLLTALYSFLFILLQMEQYSLLIGSFTLFLILAVIMFITRNINWYEITEKVNKQIDKISDR